MTTEQAPRELTDAQILAIRKRHPAAIVLDGEALNFASDLIAADRALVASQAQPAAEPTGLKFKTDVVTGPINGFLKPTFVTTLTHCGEQLPLNPTLYLAHTVITKRETRAERDARAAVQQPAEPRQDSVHAVESGGTTLPLGD